MRQIPDPQGHGFSGGEESPPSGLPEKEETDENPLLPGAVDVEVAFCFQVRLLLPLRAAV